jgi:pentalenene oxygenase
VQPLFDHRRIREYGAQIVQTATEFRDRAHWEMRPLAIDQEMLTLTLKVAVQTLFGEEDTEENLRYISGAVQTVMTYFFRRSRSAFRWPYHWRMPGMQGYHRAAGDLRQWMSEYLEESPESFAAQRLKEALPEDADAALQTALTLIMAGHETTGHALSWTLGLLAAHPEAQTQLAAEVDRVLGGRPPGSGDVDSLPYLRSVIFEALRLFPPVWLLSRSNPMSLAIGDKTFAPQTFFLVSPYITQRMAENFPDPEAFRPERWPSDATAVAKVAGYLPFGQGARSCVGRDFALMEMQLIIASFVQTLGFRPGQTFSLKPEARLSLVPPAALVLNLRRREI